MNNIQFEWDEAKNSSNQRKRGVSFELAAQVFDDPLRATTLDRVVDREERWQVVGYTASRLLLMVAYTMFDEEVDGFLFEIVRIISARRVESYERRRYEAGSSENG